MTLQEIQALVAAGYTKVDIDLLSASAPAQAPQLQPVQQVNAPAQPVSASAQPAPAQAPQPQPQPVQQVNAPAQANDFVTALAALGAAINQSAQQVPATNAQLPASLQPAQALQPQPATTPSNAGLTTEEATKLFQAWSLGQATQNIELPPTAQEVLEKRFSSLYGVDTTKKTN